MSGAAHDFPIANLDLDGGGRIGIAPLPGLNGALEDDLKAIREWRPAAVVSMTEQPEMDACGAGDLGARLDRAGIAWLHVPVPDFGGMDGANASAWPAISTRLHGYLDHGSGVLVHCRGGRGRSGMIAVRLMIERGEHPDAALRRARHRRPGAVETDAQRLWAVAPERP